MTTFMIDLWQDLREKRLWPVAVGLLAAIAAVPLVLFKPTSAPPAQPPLPSAANVPHLPVVSVDGGPTVGSQLNEFSQRNPFVPLSDLAQSASAAASGSQSPAHASASTGSGSGSGSGSGGNPVASLLHPSTGSGSSTPTTSTSTSTPGVHWFHYTADVKFGVPGKLKTLKGIQNLALLPNAHTPVVVFMGVTTDGNKAVFFIDDPSFTPSGKGTCNVSGDACRFVTLTLAKSSETFASLDGQTRYKLQLLRINQSTFTPKSSTGTSPKVSGASNGKLAGYDATQLIPTLLSLVDVGQSGAPVTDATQP